MSGPDQCPLLGIERCPLLGGSKCISSMVQLEILLYSNSMHSVYQAQYPKLFTYIAAPTICGHTWVTKEFCN